MTMSDGETIFALSSGALPAAIGVIRISGPRAVLAAEAIAGPLPKVRQARLRRFIDPKSGELLDEGLVIWFPAGGSETGEDLVELHCHGSRAAVRGVEAALGDQEGLRPAQPGEFARRSLLNGKTDLARLEGLGDLLAAETASQRQAALAMMGGALSRTIGEWADTLLSLSARIEAVLNFSDEGDVDEGALLHDVGSRIAALADTLAEELARPGSERLKQGISVVLAGPPNAGKSTLLNALVGRDAAIVSPIAGTTRDVIEIPVALGGMPFVLIDTAGLHEGSDDPIEAIGMARASAMLARADIILWLGPIEDLPAADGISLPVRAKADLLVPIADGPCSMAQLSVSAVTGAGMDALVAALRAAADSLLPTPGDYALSVRQRQIIARAEDVLRAVGGQGDLVLVAEAVRAALANLDELTGRATTEAMLDELFSGFCIGK